MLYLSGNKRGSLLGVKDTDDNIEEFVSKETIIKSGLDVVGFNNKLEIGNKFSDKYFIFRIHKLFRLF